MSPARRRVSSGVPFEQAVGYSRAVAAGDFIFVSGCTSIVGRQDRPRGRRRQADRAGAAERRARRSSSSAPASPDVVQTRMYVTDISRGKRSAEAHRLAFELAPPATTMVQVAALIDPRLLVEVEAVAHREGGPDADEEEPDESEIPPDAIRLDDPSADDAI